MALLEMRVDLSKLVDAVVSGNSEQIIAAARDQLQDPELLAQIHNREAADTLLGRIGLIAAQGDADGHTITTLAACAMLIRLLHTIPAPTVPPSELEEEAQLQKRTMPLFVTGLLASVPAVQRGYKVEPSYPEPFFPSRLAEDKTMNDMMRQAIDSNDTQLAEELLFGLYGTGADYRTLQVRTYEGLAPTFQDAGHPLIFAVRGYQLLDTVEWGKRAPNIIHWLAPHLPLRSDTDEPDWINDVRTFIADPKNSVSSVRTRLSMSKDENARPLRQIILSDADTSRVCEAVYQALIKGEASSRAVGSVIALAAADVIERVGDGDQERFAQAAHGLLFAAAVRLALTQVQDVEALPLLFTSAAFVNALQKEVQSEQSGQKTMPSIPSTPVGGGLIAASQLQSLDQLLKNQDVAGALTLSQRYLKLNHDPRALFGTIGLTAALADAVAEQGHTLQIVQAAAEEHMAWPAGLQAMSPEPFLRAALRAAAFGKRNPMVEQI